MAVQGGHVGVSAPATSGGSLFSTSTGAGAGPQTTSQIVNAGTNGQVAGPTATSTPSATQTVNPSSTPITDADLQALANKLINSAATPNPFDSFYQVAYHWRLFLVADSDVYTKTGKPTSVNALYSAIEGLPQVVVAETGITTYNIKSVETNAFVSGNSETKNAYAYKFSLVIVEPVGVGFLDALKAAAVSLNIQNMQKCPYYLELSFKGYDEAGNISNPVIGLDANRWIWQVQLLDIDTHFSAGGGEYTITAQVYNDGALEDDILTVPQALTLSGTTIGDFLTSLGQNLTAGWKLRYGAERGVVNYNFVMLPIQNPPASVGTNTNPNVYKIASDNPNTSSTRLDDISTGLKKGQIAPGTHINDIIDWLAQNNEQSQNLGLDRNNVQTQTDSSTSATNDRKFKESIIFRLQTDIQIVDYDFYSANYNKNVTFYVVPYYTQALLTGPEQRDNAIDPNVQGDMVKQLLTKNYLQKHYEYLYTGLNTEIINFDIHVSFLWNALLPKFYGAHANFDSNDYAALLTSETTNAQGNALEINLPNLRTFIDQTQAKLNDINNQISANQTIIANQSATPTAAQTAATAALKDLTTLQKGYSDQVTTSTQIYNATVKTAQLSLTTSTPAGVQYAEDLLNQATGRTITTRSNLIYQDFNYAISFRQGYKDADHGTGFVGQYHRDRSVFGSITEQLYQPVNTQLANVDLEIRGDPFWIGASNLQTQILLRSSQASVSAQNVYTGLPNYLSGDQVFLITFRYPILINDQSVPVFVTDDTFCGIYRAAQVTSTFADGKFTQKLSGYIIPLINPQTGLSNIQTTGTSTGGQSGASSTSSVGGSPTASTAAPTSVSPAAQFAGALAAAAAAQGITLTSAQIDGIVANAYRESSMNPASASTDSNGLTSAGLLQWNGPRDAAFTSYTGVAPQNATIDQQAAYTIHELQTTESGTLTALQQTTTASDAANAWIVNYERPKDPSTGQSKNLSFLSGTTLYGAGNVVGGAS
jgi:hypothetical protein